MSTLPEDEVAEWKRRFAARLIDCASWPEVTAIQLAAVSAEDWDDMDEEFRTDPEAAADEEMSCWGDDGNDG